MKLRFKEYKKVFLRDNDNKRKDANTFILGDQIYIPKNTRTALWGQIPELTDVWLEKKPDDKNNRFIWPVMCVDSDEVVDIFPLYANTDYTDKPVSEEADMPGVTVKALVFPYVHDEDVKNLSDIITELRDQRALNYTNPDVMNYVREILAAIKELNDSGYIFNEFHVSEYHPSKFYFRKDGKIIVDFSTLTTPEYLNDKPYKCDILNYPGYENVYPLEFADPVITIYNIAGTQKPIELEHEKITEPFTGLDRESQNYSLAAFLFYLMYGQMPYWGYRLAGHNIRDIHSHYYIYRDYYLRTPAFIFDPHDHIDNDLTDYGYEEKVIELWNKTPEAIRNMFMKVLCWDNALRRSRPDNPPAAEWIDALVQNGLM